MVETFRCSFSTFDSSSPSLGQYLIAQGIAQSMANIGPGLGRAPKLCWDLIAGWDKFAQFFATRVLSTKPHLKNRP